MNWTEINKSLINFLQNFYKKNKEKSGEALYDLLIKNQNFVKNNDWINKFELQYGVKSVDPFHVFASIYNNNLSDSIVEEKIKVLFNCLKLKKIVSVNLEGVPFLHTINILRSRKLETQKEIWNFFNIVSDKKIISLNFEEYKKWYGIDLENLSLFLFYINPEKYMPLDQNSRILLRHFDINTPKNFSEYSDINSKNRKI